MSNTNPTFHDTALAAVNHALVTLGQDVILTKPDLAVDSSVVVGRKAAYAYNDSRLKVLRDHVWNFARREYRVSGSVACRHDGDELPFAAMIPPRCVRLIACYAEDGRTVKYRVVGTEIRSDRPAARIVYVYDVEDLDKWTPDAYRSLVLRLAADLAKPITGRINERQLQEQAYSDSIETAKRNDAAETNIKDDAWGGNHYVEAMHGGYSRRGDALFRR